MVRLFAKVISVSTNSTPEVPTMPTLSPSRKDSITEAFTAAGYRIECVSAGARSYTLSTPDRALAFAAAAHVLAEFSADSESSKEVEVKVVDADWFGSVWAVVVVWDTVR